MRTGKVETDVGGLGMKKYLKRMMIFISCLLACFLNVMVCTAKEPEDLTRMSTEELAVLMQDYPELGRMMMYYGEDGMQDYDLFFYFLESECDIFYELLRRTDGITCLLQEYRTSGCNMETIVDGEYDPEKEQEWYAEVFGCQLIRYYVNHFTDSEFKLATQIIEEKAEVYNLIDDMTVYYYLDLPELESPAGAGKCGVRTSYLAPEEIQAREEKLGGGNWIVTMGACMGTANQRPDAGDAKEDTSETAVAEEEITLVNLSDIYNVTYVKERSAYFSKKNPDVKMIYKTGEESVDSSQILEQVLNGEGPDLLWVNASDMRMLSEKGVLMDLRTLVPKESLEQIYPGILQEGTVNDTLTGLYFDTYVSCLIANNEVWDQNSITTSDIIEVARENDGLLALIGNHTSLSKRDFLNTVVFCNPKNSPFIDVEAKESRFETAAFAELLAVAKECGDSRMGYLKDYDTVLNKLREEKLLAVTVNMMDFSEYVRLMEEYGDICHLMSYPDAPEGVTGFWSGDGFLVVNANSGHKEAVGELLTYLLSKEAQQKVTYGSIRRDVRCEEAMAAEGGSAYAEEYLAFLECCDYNPGYDWEIKEIILAGADEFFEDRCTAEEAAQAIDKEVQKYLDGLK